MRHGWREREEPYCTVHGICIELHCKCGYDGDDE